MTKIVGFRVDEGRAQLGKIMGFGAGALGAGVHFSPCANREKKQAKPNSGENSAAFCKMQQNLGTLFCQILSLERSF